MSITEKLVELIPTGRTNAIPMRDLATLLNISQRAVRVIVQRARELGCLSAPNGRTGAGIISPLTNTRRGHTSVSKGRVSSPRTPLLME